MLSTVVWGLDTKLNTSEERRSSLREYFVNLFHAKSYPGFAYWFGNLWKNGHAPVVILESKIVISSENLKKLYILLEGNILSEERVKQRQQIKSLALHDNDKLEKLLKSEFEKLEEHFRDILFKYEIVIPSEIIDGEVNIYQTQTSTSLENTKKLEKSPFQIITSNGLLYEIKVKKLNASLYLNGKQSFSIKSGFDLVGITYKNMFFSCSPEKTVIKKHKVSKISLRDRIFNREIMVINR